MFYSNHRAEWKPT